MSNLNIGILPPPKVLAQYNDLIPKGADRLLKLVENQTEHRHKIETEFVSSNIKNERRGLVLGFFVVVLFLLASVFLIINDHDISGTVLGTIDLVSLVGLFVYGSRKKNK